MTTPAKQPFTEDGAAAPRREPVVGGGVDVIDWDAAVARVWAWSAETRGHFVCFCNVHGLVTARWDPEFSQALGAADLVLPDGAPVAFMLRRLTGAAQRRIYGPDFFWHACTLAARDGLPIYLLGSSPQTLEHLVRRLHSAFPQLRIAGSESPPFRPLTDAENAAIAERVRSSGARLVWVSLGCPKQEVWMYRMRSRIPAVLLGVGAAFDFHAGTVRQAPRWMREHGLEWLFRLCAEPRRLWRRYLVTNSTFLLLAALQLLRQPFRREVSVPPST